jgi:organic radical activating enzyme
MKKLTGLIALTSNFKIVKTNGADLRKVAQWTNWFCDIGKHMVCINQHLKEVNFSECKNIGKICKKPQCWCGTDLGIPKAVNKEVLDQFRDLVKDYNGELNQWDCIDEIIAVSSADLLLDNAIHFDWVITKKCNYDCSYCPPTTHDNFSSYPSFQECKNYFEDTVKTFDINLSRYKDVKIFLTGGEPTIMKEFSELINWLKDFSSPNIVTNGTSDINDLVKWHKHSKYVISMHYEYNDIKKTKKIIEFLDSTPYRNFILLKFFKRDESYDQIMNVIQSNPKFLDWVDVRIYPLLDKFGKEKILMKQ